MLGSQPLTSPTTGAHCSHSVTYFYGFLAQRFFSGFLVFSVALAAARGVVLDALLTRVQVLAPVTAAGRGCSREAVLARHDGAVQAIRHPVRVPERVGGDGARGRHDGAIGQPHRGARRHGRVRPRADARLVRPALRRHVHRGGARGRGAVRLLAVVEELAGLRDAADLDGAVARPRGALADGDALGLELAVCRGRRLVARTVDARLVGAVVLGRGVLGGHQLVAEDAPPVACREARRLGLVGGAEEAAEGRLQALGLALGPHRVGHAAVADAALGVRQQHARGVAAVGRPALDGLGEVRGVNGAHGRVEGVDVLVEGRGHG